MKYLGKSWGKLWKEGVIVHFVTLNLREDEMKASKTTTPFLKTAACPASATLLSFRCETLAVEAQTIVTDHLKVCDFCSAEMTLLAHHQPLLNGLNKTPEIPMNLRILAESILSHGFEPVKTD